MTAKSGEEVVVWQNIPMRSSFLCAIQHVSLIARTFILEPEPFPKSKPSTLSMSNKETKDQITSQLIENKTARKQEPGQRVLAASQLKPTKRIIFRRDANIFSECTEKSKNMEEF